jgi:phosphoglycerate dehydrogenase-like enzyme
MSVSLPKVVLISNLPQDQVDIVLSYTPNGFDATSIASRLPEEEKTALVADADFLVLMGTRPSEALLRASPKLRHIQLLTAGYENVDLGLTEALNITVSNNGGANSYAVAEAAIGMILSLMRRLPEGDAFVRGGDWRGDIVGYDTFELAGKTLGIVGLGNIGKKVARRLHAFEMHVVYADIVRDEALERELCLRHLPLDEMLPVVDVVTLHVPDLRTTRGLIGEDELRLMKPSAILINTSRGSVVDEQALVRALEAKQIRGAGLDVFQREPLQSESPLLQMPNVMLSAHNAGTTYDTFFRRAEFAFRNIQAIWEGNPPTARVLPEE